MIKAVFFDIDGTLVPLGARGIPQGTVKALKTLRQKGVKVFIATGRHPGWIDNLGDNVFDGYVTTNGALCFAGDGKTEIHSCTISAEDKARMVSFCANNDMPFVIVPAYDEIFATGVNDAFTEAAKMLNIPYVPIKDVSLVNDYPVVQMMVFASQEEIDASGLFEHTLLSCHATSWCSIFADILPNGSDKSVGIDRMIEHFGIKLSETMAFGDGANDVEMLRHVGIGVAMGNASAEVQASADYVTLSVDEDGVAAALRHFGLL